MFLHEFTYELKCALRKWDDLFWVLVFPMVLGLLFHFAFGSLNDTTEAFHTIPVAACYDENEDNPVFMQVLSMLSEEGETPLLSVTKTSWDLAQELLKDGTVHGIFRAGKDVSLTCTPADATNSSSTLAIEQSILEALLREYRTHTAAVTEILKKDPSCADKLFALIGTRAAYGAQLNLTDGNMDNTVQYFFNLIAMACLFTSFSGCQIAIKNQANLSALGARKCVTPINKILSVFAQLLSGILLQFLCVITNVLFLIYILRIDFGTSLPSLSLTCLVGSTLGVNFGFFIGSIGKIGEKSKAGILVCASLLCCALSGLMFSNMRSVVEHFCPLLNKINPAVQLSDSFLTLNIYGFNGRYLSNLLSLLVSAAVFSLAGCLIIRRKTYANL